MLRVVRAAAAQIVQPAEQHYKPPVPVEDLVPLVQLALVQHLAVSEVVEVDQGQMERVIT